MAEIQQDYVDIDGAASCQQTSESAQQIESVTSSIADGERNVFSKMSELAETSDIDYEAISKLNSGIDFEAIANYEFGGKLASQIGAGLSEEHGQSKNEKTIEAETRMAQAARPQNWKEKVAGMSFGEKVEETLACLGRKNNQKEILFDLLVYCDEERAEHDVEAFLESHKQFADGHHSASKYLLFMERTGALDELEYDSDDMLITEDMRNELRELGAPEDEIDELVASWRYRTTDAGKEALRRFDPALRTRAMLDEQKHSRRASFQRLLEFCEQPRLLDEITSFMDGDPGLEVDARTGVMMMQPSAYIGMLDQAGALTWEGGWKTTEGGTKILESYNFE